MIDANNSLKEQIEQIQDYCERLIPDCGEHASWFRPAATEEEIAEWERTHSITIPESYKDWLRFSNDSQIVDTTARFVGLNGMRDDLPYLRRDWVYIGSLIGDGEVVCFSKSSGKFIRFLDITPHEFENFSQILKSVIHLLKGDCGEETMSKESIDLLLSMAKENEERKAREAKEGV